MNDTISNRAATPFVPLLLLSAALLLWAGAQMVQLLSERSTLKTLLTSQSTAFAASQKLRVQLDAIASGTQRLADGGNQNAKLVVEELRKRGITINPATTPVAPLALPAPGSAAPVPAK